MLPQYEFLGSAYYKTESEDIILSLDSINSQYYKPKSTVLILDGPVKPQVEILIKRYEKVMNLKMIRLKKNVGLGLALREGLKSCTSTYVLRFDIGDFNEPQRALKQIKYIHNGSYDIISSFVYEFHESKDFPKRIKKVPLKYKNIVKSIFIRCPFNHPSVCFKREAIINLKGGYRNCLYYEDYDLWIRAVFKKLKLSNMPDLLVGMQVTNQIEARRGLKLVICEAKLLKTFREESLIAMICFIPFLLFRSLLRLLPSCFLRKFYYWFLRA